MRQSSVLLMLAFVAAGCAPTPANTPTAAELAEEQVRVQSALFSNPALCTQECLWEAPGMCAHPCFWSLPVGEMSSYEWRLFLIDVFPVRYQRLREVERLPFTGTFLDSPEFTLSAWPPISPNEDVVDRISLAFSPQWIGDYDASGISPAAILRSFGAPDAAHLWLQPNQAEFDIFFWYETAGLTYSATGTARAGRICLGLDDIGWTVIDRRSHRDIEQDVEPFWPYDQWPHLEDAIVESLDDLPRLAAESDAPCLTLR